MSLTKANLQTRREGGWGGMGWMGRGGGGGGGGGGGRRGLIGTPSCRGLVVLRLGHTPTI